MTTGQTDYIQKAIRSAEQAAKEDKAQNYEAAAQHYMMAVDWLKQAMKFDTMSAQMKQTIRPIIESYGQRAEEIINILKNGSDKRKAVADVDNCRRMMQYMVTDPKYFRFEKRIHIPLPDLKERALMFKIHLGTDTFHTIQEDQWIQLARRTERYSGADIAVVCKEALHRPIRRLCLATHFKQILNPKFDDHRQLWLPCSFDDPHAVPLTFDKILSAELCEPPVTLVRNSIVCR
ncbi:unnamed protein product [Rotaria sordida]|uniref:MIT domain-containing protein n=1 Tax=Rotaria sordida TaxID=392033 RepID=A0A815HZX2_9BILA|nr:unnamed protein product [Rotaria sordida]